MRFNNEGGTSHFEDAGLAPQAG